MNDNIRINERSNTVRCAIYTRSASETQGLVSLNEQELNCRKAADQHGWIVEEDYVRRDFGGSGTSLPVRDGLKSLLVDAKKHPRSYDVLMVDDSSRIARNLTILVEICEGLHDHGVILYFVGQKLDSRDENFRMVLTTFGMLDNRNHS